MKFHIFLTFLLVVVVAIMAAPASLTTDNESEDQYMLLDPIQDATAERADRQRRVTCDLLSFNGILQHTACAANCLSMGKAGGRCENGICICRKTTFKDLWDKRFG